MIYKCSSSLHEKLLSLPETGMGYQIIDQSTKSGQQKIIFINSAFGYDIEDYLNKTEYKNGVPINLDIDFSNLVVDRKVGAIDAKEQVANGSDIQKFVRYSAFENDFRIDTENMCLRPGSFTTNFEDSLTTGINKYDPRNRYALPSPLEIKYMFHIKSIHGDTFQKGIVQPAFGHKGEGIECFFKNGTSPRSLIIINK